MVELPSFLFPDCAGGGKKGFPRTHHPNVLFCLFDMGERPEEASSGTGQLCPEANSVARFGMMRYDDATFPGLRGSLLWTESQERNGDVASCNHTTAGAFAQPSANSATVPPHSARASRKLLVTPKAVPVDCREL